MTDQVAKLLEELNEDARKKLKKPRIISIDPGHGGEPPRHVQCRSQYETPLTDYTDEIVRDIAEYIFKSSWSWPVCKEAFPHDIDAAMRLYRKIHGEDPPHLRMEP